MRTTGFSDKEDTCFIQKCDARAVEVHSRILRRNSENWDWLVCSEHIPYSKDLDEQNPDKSGFASLYHRILYPDVCTPEEVVCIEVILTRWIDFLHACVVSSSGP